MDPWMFAAGLAGPALDFIGSRIEGEENREAAADANKKNAALQREFAQQGIRWRVEDAKAAGLHPLFALGAQTAAASPSYVSGGSSGTGEGLSKVGQNLSRAIAATSTLAERELQQLQIASVRADIEGKTLDNQYRLSVLKGMSHVGPPMAGSDNFMPGQGNSPLVKEKPLERVISAPGRPAQEAGWRPDVSYSRTDSGLTPMVPESLSESLEDDMVGKVLWRVRNQLLPNLTGEGKPPLHMLPKGTRDWDYDGWKQEWKPSIRKGSYPWARFKKWWSK